MQARFKVGFIHPVTVEGGVASIHLRNGNTVVVDTNVLPRIRATFRRIDIDGRTSGKPYPSGKPHLCGSGTIRLSRWLTNAPHGRMVDHINGDALDNRLSNLRVVTARQNSLNKAARSSGRTGIRGVSIRPSGWYSARHAKNGSVVYLGTYTDKEAAACAVYVALQRQDAVSAENYRRMYIPDVEGPKTAAVIAEAHRSPWSVAIGYGPNGTRRHRAALTEEMEELLPRRVEA